jgi:NADH-quinone oxidoreductase subunit L
VVTLPLVLLAIPSVLIGFFTIDPLLFGDFFADAITVNGDKHHAMHALAQAFHGPLAMASHALGTAPFWLALAGVATAYVLYMVKTAWPAAIQKVLQPLHTLLDHKYYLDAFNEQVLARGARWMGQGFWRWGDQALIDGAVVNGSWRWVNRVSVWVRKGQTGYLYHYALAMIMGVFLLMTWFVWLQP